MNEELKKLIEELSNGDGKVLGPFKIDSLKDVPKIIEKMEEPIVIFKGTRIGVQTNVRHCSFEEAKDVCIQIIASALNLFHQNERNDMLYEAIQRTDDKDGELYEDEYYQECDDNKEK